MGREVLQRQRGLLTTVKIWMSQVGICRWTATAPEHTTRCQRRMTIDFNPTATLSGWGSISDSSQGYGDSTFPVGTHLQWFSKITSGIKEKKSSFSTHSQELQFLLTNTLFLLKGGKLILLFSAYSVFVRSELNFALEPGFTS